MSIEFFRPESQRPLDADGYELPPWLNPFLSDFDPDLARQADIAWLNENPTLPPITGGAPEPFEPSDEDWDDYARFCEDVERSNALRRMEDAEFEARMRYGC